MITKINRADILSAYSAVRDEILQLQTELYDPDQLDYLTSEAEKAAYLEMFDARDYPKKTVTKYYKVLSFHHIELMTYPMALAERVRSLLSKLKIDTLVILSHIKSNFFGEIQNQYAPLKTSYQKFLGIAGSTEYKEGFKIDLEDLPLAIEIFFWIARCDSKAPEYILFFDADNQLGFFICQYGNLHTIEFEKEILTHKLLLSLSLEEIKSRCYDKLTADGKIAGRK